MLPDLLTLVSRLGLEVEALARSVQQAEEGVASLALHLKANT